MTIRRSLAAQGLLLAAALVLSLVAALRTPATVAVHFGLDGRPDGWGSKWVALLTFPLAMAFMGFLTVSAPRLSPAGRIAAFERTYGLMMFLVAAMFAAMHVALVLKTAGSSLDLVRALMGVTFLAWIPLGNSMGKVGPNRTMGIRTPWTLSNERVWRASHRAAGRTWVVGGAFGMLLVLVGAPASLLVAYLMLLCLAPVLESYLIHKSLGD